MCAFVVGKITESAAIKFSKLFTFHNHGLTWVKSISHGYSLQTASS